MFEEPWFTPLVTVGVCISAAWLISYQREAKLRKELSCAVSKVKELELELQRISSEKQVSEDKLSQKTRDLQDMLCAYNCVLSHFETANFPILGIDVDGRIYDWNSKAEEITGYSKAEAIGSVFLSMVSDDEQPGVKQVLDEIIAESSLTGEHSHRNLEFTLKTKRKQKLWILLNVTTFTRSDKMTGGLMCIAQDITEHKVEVRRRMNYLDVCGAAVWSLKARFSDSERNVDLSVNEIEQLISRRAQTNLWDPRMVLWRASFVSIVSAMCQEMWKSRQSDAGASNPPGKFSYEFSFEATNGQVKWYKVEGHEDVDSAYHGSAYDFEATGYVQEVTLMYIEKIINDRWQKWWSKMCHMVFDATLLVDTQEYRVLNAWGEEKVFGSKLACPNQPIMQLVRQSDGDSMKEALNEVACSGQPGRSMRLVRPNSKEEENSEIAAHCYFLSADPENPNECMVGIRLSVVGTDECMWNVSPCRFLTLEDLSRVARVAPASLCRARSHRHRHARKNGRKRDIGGGSSTSLTSIPEDLYEDAGQYDIADSSEEASSSNDTTSQDAMANASIDNRSLPSLPERLRQYITREPSVSPVLTTHCTLKHARQTYRIPMSELGTFDKLLHKVKELTGVVLDNRTRLVMNGRQVKSSDMWMARNDYKKISLMIIGSSSPRSPPNILPKLRTNAEMHCDETTVSPSPSPPSPD